MPVFMYNFGVILNLPLIPAVRLVSLMIISPKKPFPSIPVPPISPKYPVPPKLHPTQNYIEH